MKRTFLLILLFSALTGLVVAQGWLFGGPPPYDRTKPPATSLPDAYAAALTQIGAATNRFYCVSASVLENTKNGSWRFTFTNTNGQTARIDIQLDGRRPMFPDRESLDLLR
jgi:hypothetical protein